MCERRNTTAAAVDWPLSTTTAASPIFCDLASELLLGGRHPCLCTAFCDLLCGQHSLWLPSPKTLLLMLPHWNIGSRAMLAPWSCAWRTWWWG